MSSTRQYEEARRALGRAESRARLDGLPHVAKHYATIRLVLRAADKRGEKR